MNKNSLVALASLIALFSGFADVCPAQDTMEKPAVEQSAAGSGTKSEASDDEKWESLLDKEMSKFVPFMGIPHPSVKGLPEGTFQSKKMKGTPMGLNNDVKNVFSIVEENGEPVLKITGEIFGGLTSKKEYENYHFRTKFRWGEKKWEPRLNAVRDNGILYHCVGKHGRFWEVWKSSIEYQVQEKDLGDLYALGGTSAEVRVSGEENKKKRYDVESDEFLLKGNCSAGVEPDKPHGEWNDLEIYTVGSTSVHIANGKILMVLETKGEDATS